MEFISAKDFLNLDKEIQKVFINWWKPSMGDLFRNGEGKYALHKAVYVSPNNIGDTNIFCALSEDKFYKKEKVVPLFTEGQLRKFIEEKTESKIIIQPSFEGKYHVGYDKYCAWSESGDYSEIVYCDDLLQAYWQVAVQIAKESINS